MEKTISLVLAAKVGQGMATAVRRFSGSMDMIRQRAQAVNRALGQVETYRRLKRELGGVKQAVRSGAMSVEDGRRAWVRHARALRKVREELRAAGIEVKNLAAQQRRLVRQKGLVDRRLAARARMAAGRKMRQGGFSDMAGALAPAMAVAVPIKLAIAWESAMADVRKVVDTDAAGIERLKGKLQDMAKTIPINFEGLAAIAASAGQLGVAAQDIPDFVDTAAKMAVAFDMLPDQAGKAMAKLSNLYGIPIGQIGRLGDAINHLADNTSAEAGTLVDALSRIGGSAKVFGLGANQAAALAGAMLSQGETAETAATSINAMLNRLMAADAQGERFQRILAAMGLSARKLKGDIQRDAQGALEDLLARLSEMDKSRRMDALANLFGPKATSAIARLVEGLGRYRANLKLMAKEQYYAGSLQRDFEDSSRSTASQLQLMKNAFSRLGVSFNTQLLPYIKQGAILTRRLTDKAVNLSKEFPGLTRVVALSGSGLVGLTLATREMSETAHLLTDGIMTLGSGIKKAISWMRDLDLTTLMTNLGLIKQGVVSAALAVKQWVVVGATKAWAAAQWLVNTAMEANPLGLVIAGVVALAAGAYLVVKHWSKIKEFFAGLWAGIKKMFLQGVLFVLDKAQYLTRFIPGLGDTVNNLKAKVEAALKAQELARSRERARVGTKPLERTARAMQAASRPKEHKVGGTIGIKIASPLPIEVTEFQRQGEVDLKMDAYTGRQAAWVAP